jgi:hypothetical protein
LETKYNISNKKQYTKGYKAMNTNDKNKESIQECLNKLLDKFKSYKQTDVVKAIEYDSTKQDVYVCGYIGKGEFLDCTGLTAKEVWTKVAVYVKNNLLKSNTT